MIFSDYLRTLILTIHTYTTGIRSFNFTCLQFNLMFTVPYEFVYFLNKSILFIPLKNWLFLIITSLKYKNPHQFH